MTKMLFIECIFIKLHMNKNILLSFGHQIRHERKKLHLSQEEFASIVGVHRTYMGAIERGEKNITLLNIQKISNALNLKISCIFSKIENLETM